MPCMQGCGAARCGENDTLLANGRQHEVGETDQKESHWATVATQEIGWRFPRMEPLGGVPRMGGCAGAIDLLGRGGER